MLHLRTFGRQIAAKDCYGAIVPNGILEASDDAGAFLITKSGDKVANLLNISKFTLYSYMDAGK